MNNITLAENAREVAVTALAFIQGAYSMIQPAQPGPTYAALLDITEQLDAARLAHPYSNHPVYFALVAKLREQMPAAPRVSIAPQEWFHLIGIQLHQTLFGYLETLVYQSLRNFSVYDVTLHEMQQPPPFTQDAERIDQAWAVWALVGKETIGGRIDRLGLRFALSLPGGEHDD
jgi:hypothetical protein